MRPLFLSFFLSLALTAAGRAIEAAPAGFGKDVAPFFDVHCYDCHGDGEHKGGLALDKLPVDFSSAETMSTWVKVLDQMESGEMPPKKEARPASAALKAAATWLRTNLLAADRRRQQTEGRVVARRLNRAEYENTVRDLLAIETPLKGFLPE